MDDVWELPEGYEYDPGDDEACQCGHLYGAHTRVVEMDDGTRRYVETRCLWEGDLNPCRCMAFVLGEG